MLIEWVVHHCRKDHVHSEKAYSREGNTMNAMNTVLIGEEGTMVNKILLPNRILHLGHPL